MPASRIVFALSDLKSELDRITPVRADGDPAPVVEIGLDAATFNAVVGEIENHVGRELKRDGNSVGMAVRFGGVLLRALPGAD